MDDPDHGGLEGWRPVAAVEAYRIVTPVRRPREWQVSVLPKHLVPHPIAEYRDLEVRILGRLFDTDGIECQRSAFKRGKDITAVQHSEGRRKRVRQARLQCRQPSRLRNGDDPPVADFGVVRRRHTAQRGFAQSSRSRFDEFRAATKRAARLFADICRFSTGVRPKTILHRAGTAEGGESPQARLPHCYTLPTVLACGSARFSLLWR